MRPPRLGLLFALAASLTILPAAPASAVTIHRHHERQIVKRGIGEKIPVSTVRWTEVVTVAPRDSDEDGVADKADDCPQTAGSINGCPPAPVVTTSYGGEVSLDGTAASVMACESTNDPTAVDPTGTYTGAFQFDDQTWKAASGLDGRAADYPLSVQTQAFDNWYPSHPDAWPICG